MNFFGLLFAGLPDIVQPSSLLAGVAGTVIGIIFGTIPGLTATMGLAIFLPLTFDMSPSIGMTFLVGIYAGAVYGGSVSAILMNIPGTVNAVVTGLDGYPMARRGHGGRAIGIATLASGIGGLFGTVMLIVVAPALALVALSFSAQEYVGLALLGLAIVSYISSESMLRGVVGCTIGLLLATVGQDLVTAYPRFTFGFNELLGGLEMIPVLVGFFGVTEILVQIEAGTEKAAIGRVGGVLTALSDIRQAWTTLLRSSAIGTFVGAIPAAGGAIASMAAYGIEKRFAGNPDRYGKGEPRGIIAAESANNAAVGGAFIPTLSLGIPGDPQTAVLLGALIIHGLTPGPSLFTLHPQVVSTVYLANVLASILLVVIGLAGARSMSRIITVPTHVLLPALLMLCVVGAFAMRNSTFDIGVMMLCGVSGLFLQKVGIETPPIVLGFVLGPILEENVRRALILSEGGLMTFFTRPISLVLLLANVFIAVSPMILSRIRRRRSLLAQPETSEPGVR